MNWYKKAKRDKIAAWDKTFLGLSAAAIAIMLGLSLFDVEKKIENEPQQLRQEIQQKTQEQPQKVETPIIPQNAKSNENIEDLRSMIIRHEGKRNKVYHDTKGNLTIGIGFNLHRKDASQKLAQIGENINEVLQGKELSDEKIYYLFEEDLKIATQNAKQYLPNFDQHPQNVQNVIIDMSFNMGYPTLSKFINLRKALLNFDYKSAVQEMRNSEWYSQTGNRPEDLIKTMRDIK